MAFCDTWVITSRDVNQLGLVTYPRLFTTVNRSVEDLMERVGYPFDALIERDLGFPIVHAEADYRERIGTGEEVTVELVPKPGEQSVSFLAMGTVEDRPVFTVTETHAMVEIHDIDDYVPTTVPEGLVNELRSIQ